MACLLMPASHARRFPQREPKRMSFHSVRGASQSGMSGRVSGDAGFVAMTATFSTIRHLPAVTSLKFKAAGVRYQMASGLLIGVVHAEPEDNRVLLDRTD